MDEGLGAGAGWNELEEKIKDIWRDLLPDAIRSIDDDFFDLGGHSLLLVQMLVDLRRLFPCDVPVESFLEQPNIRFLLDFAKRAHVI